MNPEGTNPFENPVALGGGTANNPTAMPYGDAGMGDSLAVAQDNLTSAGMAASTGGGVMDLSQLGASNPEAVMTSPIEEPLIPAAPVPGSIGSVTSVPPLATPTNPELAAAPSNMTAANGTSLFNNEPTTPFNPFAPQASTPAGNITTSGPMPAPAPVPTAAPNPAPTPISMSQTAFQPTAPAEPAKKNKPNTLTLLLTVLCVVLLATTIIFAILYISTAKKLEDAQSKVVYVPSVSVDNSDEAIEVLSCSRGDDYAWYGGLDYPVYGTQTLSATYSNDALKGISMTYSMPFGNADISAVAQGNFAAQHEAMIGAISSTIAVNYSTDESGSLSINFVSDDANFSEADAATLLYGYYDGQATDMASVTNFYENSGFSCSAN